MPTLQCIVENDETDRLETQLVENLLRSDLKPIEEARAFQQLVERHGWTGRQLAERLRISESKVSRAMALLELPEDVQDQVDAGELKGAAVRKLTAKPRKPRKKGKPKTTRKIRVRSATVSIAVNRKTLSDAEAVQILGQAVEQLQGEKRRKAA